MIRTLFPIPFWAVLLAVVGCAPPWRGEECNFHVATVSFLDSTGTTRTPVADLGYTGILQLERGLSIDPEASIPELDFDRVEPAYTYALPLDPEATRSSFVLSHPDGNDTIVFRYSSTLGRDPDCGYAFILDDLEYSFRGGAFLPVTEVNHPKIVGEVEVQR